MAATTDPKQLSPKFTLPFLVGILVFAAGEALSLVTVEAFAFAGNEWASVLHKLVTVAAMALVAYYKMDPLRQNYAAQVQAEAERQRVARLQDQGIPQIPADAVVVREGEPMPYIPPTNVAG